MIFTRFTYFLCGLLSATAASHAYNLDWAAENWVASNSANQSQTLTDVDGSGIDVSISILLSGAGSLSDTTRISGGNLILGVDYPNRNRAKNYIDVTISFSSLVQSISFSLNDVDKGGTGSNAYWEDVIENITGTGLNGATTATASWGSGITPDTTSDPGQTLFRGNSSNDWDNASRLTLTWSSAVSSVTFRYSGGEHTGSNPNYQVIGVTGIRFLEYQGIPEPGTYLAGGLSLLVAGFFVVQRRRMQQTTVQLVHEP